jgi:DnaJ-class molecular chaperone
MCVVEIFQNISKAYDILTDSKAKYAYDALYRARAERQRQLAEMNKDRRAARDDLIERENQVKRQRSEARDAEIRFEAEVLHLVTLFSK